ncbi:MAG: SDR family NAD(P)-dependent oxidoreductase [Planctomycetota bacterium]|nr:SDR family NAD(P)-dependent oxidoreductase [Planctomycetota bacterium]MDA1211736.1 SDR family NAD(P)-dependent oxidoreductase [Planctomycetota bacterium]
MHNKLLTGRTAVVTGASDGIGRATSLLLAEQGARVFAADIRQNPENQTVFSELDISFQICDVRQESDLQRVFAEVISTSGRVDILVNNAGVGMVKQITDVTEADWNSCIDTNLKGPFFGCKHAIGQMQKNGGGAIVNIASNAGILPRAHDPVYSISKLALVGLTKSLALCHARDRIRINAVCPGPVGDTGMIREDIARADDPEAFTQSLIDASPLAKACERMISPREIAEAVLYLVSDAAQMVTGTIVAIDGGKSLGVPPKS